VMGPSSRLEENNLFGFFSIYT